MSNWREMLYELEGGDKIYNPSEGMHLRRPENQNKVISLTTTISKLTDTLLIE